MQSTKDKGKLGDVKMSSSFQADPKKSSRVKPGDIKEALTATATIPETIRKGMPSIFVIARVLAAKRRAKKQIETKGAATQAPSPRSSRLTPRMPAGNGPVDKSPRRFLQRPASPSGKLAPLKLPVGTREQSPVGSTSFNSGAGSARDKTPSSDRTPAIVHRETPFRIRMNRAMNSSQKYGVQITPKSVSSPKKSSQKAPPHRVSTGKIDREAFRYMRQGDIRSAYLWDENADELGRGGCGVVFTARARDNPARQVAVKRVLTKSLAETEMLRKEIELLRKLDHPNVLRLFESFEDGKTVYLIMELCKGGDLFERLCEEEHCTEKYCSQVAAQICGALAHCHDQGICHRDLKPENLLLLSQADDAPIKVADFGLSKHLSQEKPSQKSLVDTCKERRKVVRRLRTFAGTVEYMAPEVIRIKDEKSGPDTYYDFRCDTWSFGVIVHMMLTGNWPFKLEQVAAYVAEDVPLPDLQLSGLSPDARDFVTICLGGDFQKRPTPADLLKHPFLKFQSAKQVVSITPMAERFSHFANLSGVKKAALTAAVRHLKGFELEELRSNFELFDMDHDGTVTLSEFKKAIAKWPNLLSEADFDSAEELFQAIDSDSSGQISYTEFLAAAMDVNLAAREDLVRGAFDAFDQTGGGEITSEDIRRVMGGRRQGTKDLAEIGIVKGEAAHFESFREHLRSP